MHKPVKIQVEHLSHSPVKVGVTFKLWGKAYCVKIPLSDILLAVFQHTVLKNAPANILTFWPRKTILKKYFMVVIPRISAEKFICTFSWKCNGVVLLDFFAEEQKWRVNIDIPRQIPCLNTFIKCVAHKRVVKDNFPVLCVGIFWHHRNKFVVGSRLKIALLKIFFVVTVFNRVGVDFAELVFLVVHWCGLDNYTAVKPSRKEKAQRNITHKLSLNCISQEISRLFNGSYFIVCMLLCLNGVVFFSAKLWVPIHCTFARIKLKYSLENSERRRSCRS